MLETAELIVWLLGALLTVTLVLGSAVIWFFRQAMEEVKQDLRDLTLQVGRMATDTVRIQNLDDRVTAMDKRHTLHAERPAHRDHPHPTDPIAFRDFMKDL